MKLEQYLNEKIKIEREHVDSYSGQHNYVLGAYDDGNIVGTLEYTEYENIPSISMIQVVPKYKSKGIATKLVIYLQLLYPQTEIKWGYTTSDGNRLKNKLKSKLYTKK